jgi:hypothetical protein
MIWQSGLVNLKFSCHVLHLTAELENEIDKSLLTCTKLLSVGTA